MSSESVDAQSFQPSKLILPENFDLERTGWNTFSEYLLDISGIISKPLLPSLRGNPLRYQGTEYLRGNTAKDIEEEVVDV